MAARRRKKTVEEKRRLLELYDRLPRMTQKAAASRLNITRSLLWSLLRNRSLIEQGEKEVRGGKAARLEAALWRWIDGSRKRGAPASDLSVHRKAMELAARLGLLHFRATPTWYRGFKRRENTMRERFHIYAEDADRAARSAPQEQQAGGVEGPDADLEQRQPPPVKHQPTVLRAAINGGMQTVTVPSLYQMKEAMKTLATGLLYRGFSDFKLLHQFEEQVANVVNRSMSQGSQDSFLA